MAYLSASGKGKDRKGGTYSLTDTGMRNRTRYGGKRTMSLKAGCCLWLDSAKLPRGCAGR